MLASTISAVPVSKPEADGYDRPRGPRPAALKVGPAQPYSFAYEVIDPLGDANFGHRESSDGVVTEGEYRVVLPDGRLQIVTYTASDATGYVADVKYEGTAKFPPAAVPAPLIKAAGKPVAPAPAVSGLAPRAGRQQGGVRSQGLRPQAGPGGRRGFA